MLTLLNIINDKPPRQNSTIMNTSLLLLDLIHKWDRVSLLTLKKIQNEAKTFGILEFYTTTISSDVFKFLV